MKVVVVGAGVAGLAAADVVAAAGHEVVVFDKGRSPGGRLATRRIRAARLDHGAQFFTVRGDELAARVEHWRAEGTVAVWCHGFGVPDGYPRYVAPGGMTAIAKALAAPLDVRCEHLVFTIRPSPGGWRVTTDDGIEHPCDAVVITCPLPQAVALLVESGVALPQPLVATEYDRTIALLAVLDRPSGVPPPGGIRFEELGGGTLSFVADNHAKGVSPVPALTVHASPSWSEANWDSSIGEVTGELVSAAAPILGDAAITEMQVKRWRFATPRSLWPEPCWVAPGGTLVLAGDAFAGPRETGSNLEGAFTSGLAAARTLLA